MGTLVNRSRIKGTFAETGVADYLHDNGWPYAERRALAGAFDKGDITGTPGLAWEVKYAGAGLRMAEWMGETQAEKFNCRADHGILVIKPAGRGLKRIDDWFAAMRADDFQALWMKAWASNPTLKLFERDPEAYVASRLGDQLVAIQSRALAGEFPVLTLRPRGLREQPELWYRVTTLVHITRLLRLAGYGSPLPEEVLDATAL